jgi:hypothetical protein
MLDDKIIKLSPVKSQEVARQNISKKIEILEEWLRNGIPWENLNNQIMRDDDGCRICIYFPTSLRSFNTWCTAKYTSEEAARLQIVYGISGNGIDTINKYPELKKRALDLMQALSTVARTQREVEGPNRIALLEMEIQRLNIFINNQASKLVQFQRSNATLSKQMLMVEKREKGNFEELKKNYDILDAQNSRLREEIAVLTKQLKNIYSLKGVKSES